MDIHSANSAYKRFAAQRDALTALLQQVSDTVEQLDMTQARQSLARLGQKVANESFKIMVVGTFKNGKSTFINSFLGDDVLPAYSIPCTAVINEVKYGRQKRAVLHFREPLPDPLPEELADRARAHMQAHGMKNVPPLEIPYDEIEDYVVIPMGEDPAQMLLESPYERVELYWPMELLQNGVQIIDSPGLNEHATRTRVTMDYLNRADAILMVFNAQQLCSEREMSFVSEDLKGQGFADAFFVVNRFDCISRREQEAVKQFARAKLRDYTDFGESGIYFVSALDALEGKLDDDPIKYQASGMAPFEGALSSFLLRAKGKAKLAQPARELKRILTEEALYKVIPLQRTMLSTNLDQVRSRYENMRPKLEMLTLRKEKLRAKLAERIDGNKSSLRRVVLGGLRELEQLIPKWAAEFAPATTLGSSPNEQKLRAVMNEISDHITAQVEQHQRTWRETSLTPLLKERAEEIFEIAQNDAARILEQIDRLQDDMGAQNTPKQVNWQRLLGGLSLEGVELQAVEDPCSVVGKSMASRVGTGAVLFALGMINPVTMFLALAGSLLYKWAKGEEKSVAKVKTAMVEAAVSQLRQNVDANADATVEKICQKLWELAEGFLSGLDQQITQMDQQMQAIIAQMEQGAEQVQRREEALNACEQQLRQQSARLDELIFSLVKE